jgi:hypothetical protein
MDMPGAEVSETPYIHRRNFGAVIALLRIGRLIQTFQTSAGFLQSR